jgi:hypothetical protein
MLMAKLFRLGPAFSQTIRGLSGKLGNVQSSGNHANRNGTSGNNFK